MKKTIALSLLLLLLAVPAALAHCQVPCGIYDDAARITTLREDATTIAKATANIVKTAGAHEAAASAQMVRWTMTREQHASHIIEVVSEYFLTQKIAPVPPEADEYDAYLEKLADHHAVMHAAMKTKQTVSEQNLKALAAAIDQIATYW